MLTQEMSKGRTPCRPATALLGLLLLAQPVAAAPPAPGGHSVLVVDAEDAWRPGYVSFMTAFQAALKGATTTPVAVYAENLDLARFESPAYQRALRAWYEAKYGDRRLDAVVAVGPAVLGPLQTWRAEFWPDVPLVFVADARTLAQIGLPAGATGVTFGFDAPGSVRAGLALLPDTQRVALVGGADPYTRSFVTELRNTFADRLEWIDLTGLSMADLKRRVATLPEHTLVFFTTLFRDGAGQAWVPRDALDAFAPHANRPIFSLFGTYLGHGIVGGALFHVEILGPETARVVAQVLEGQPPASIPIRHVAANVLEFDWTELRRWDLDERRLPHGSQVLNRPPSLWAQHRRAVLAALGVLVAQGLVIGGLLLERRRRRAETNLRRLSGRLLTAQEEEGRRIARNLHDDVGQRLALLAIEAEELHTRPPSSQDGLSDRARDIATKAQGLASDIHRIAYELHPARLEHLGFPAAVRRFVEDLRGRHGLAVDVVETDWPRDVSPDVALCLYRVTQEALQNVVRHSGAREARVSLEGHPDRLTVTVSDTGVGFEAAARQDDGGLGLTGMRERLRLVGGKLVVDATPGGGTRIRARVPREAPSVAQFDTGDGRDHAEAPRPAR